MFAFLLTIPSSAIVEAELGSIVPRSTHDHTARPQAVTVSVDSVASIARLADGWPVYIRD